MSNTTSIGYTGEVRITVKGGKKTKTKNNGTPHLFYLLCNLLSNPSEYKEKVPKYMDVRDGDPNAENTRTLLYAPMPILTREVTSLPNLRYTCVLNNSNLSSISSNIYLYLMDESKTITYAYVELDSYSVESIATVKDSAYGQAIIDWTLSFGNTNTEE